MDEELLNTNTDLPDAALPGDPADGGVERGPLDDAPPPSIRDTLSAAYKAENAKANPPSDAVIAAENAAGRKYDKATGRFVPNADAAPRAPATTVPPATAGAKPAADAAPSTAPVNAPAGPPTSWSPEAKAAFAAASPALQQAVAKREAEYASGIQQYRQRVENYDKVLTPYRQMFDGVPDHEALGNILTWFGHITRDPSTGIPELARFLGFDLSTVGFDAGESPPPNSSIDPRLIAQINALSGKVGEVLSWREQQEQSRTRETLSAWASKPGHEHFEAVRVDMGKLWQAGIATDLDAAYTKACAMHGLSPAPAPQPAAVVPPVNPAKRVVQARHAAVSVRPSSPNGAAVNGAAKPAGSVRESLERSFAAHRG